MKCKDCVYCYADVDEDGCPTSREYCHTSMTTVTPLAKSMTMMQSGSPNSTSTTNFDAFLQDM